MSEAARILLVEDDENHAELVRRAFEGLEARFLLSVVGSVGQARKAVAAAAPDLMITDLKLPDGRGIELVPADRDAAPFAVVVMTSHGDECVAVEAMKSGALDYVVKDERLLSEMPRIAERALREWRHIADKYKTEQELRQRERELRHAQKMEAIGRLASGIAHDYNNVLTGIIGCADVALSKLDSESSARPFIDEIRASARSAASIADRLLAFVRHREEKSEVLDVNQITRGVESMLRHLLGTDVELSVELSASQSHVLIEPGELDQILMNLAVNARDAMPAGGRLAIRTRNAELDAEQASRFVDLEAGPYLLLEVTDSGGGMDEATKSRAFEPFFTTKEIGKGTGLGLSTVYAIVRANGGTIEVDSALGSGTCFRIYLPLAEPLEAASNKNGVPRLRGSGQTVLLVEDEPTVRLAMRHYLEQGGYRVLEASDASSAATWCCSPSGHVDLVVTDVVMPGGGGKRVTETVRQCCPGMPVLYVSAHPAHVLEQEERIEPGAAVLRKPFAPEDLLERVHTALAPAPQALPRSTRPQLLLVEDERAARMAMAELLRDYGFDVLETASGAEALAACEGRSVDVMLTDLGLPDVGGVELAERARALQPQLRVLFASGYRPDDARLKQVLKRPDTAFVEKPIEIDEIARILNRLLSAPSEQISA